jgi:hypothetical protein
MITPIMWFSKLSKLTGEVWSRQALGLARIVPAPKTEGEESVTASTLPMRALRILESPPVAARPGESRLFVTVD